MRPATLLPTLVFVLAASLAWSAPRIPAVTAPDVVREGAEYETVVPALPAGVREFELFLLVEDGRGRLVRLTGEHEGAGGTLRWRMPRVGAARARLVLRAGGRFGETESEPSGSFRVEAGAARALPEVLRGEDELERHFVEGEAQEPALLPPGAPLLGAAREPVPAVTPQRDEITLPGARVGLPGDAPEPTRPSTPRMPTRTRRPAFVPLRN